MRIIHPIAREAPPLTGPVGEFQAAIITSHFIWFTSGVQVFAGLLLLANRYVAFAVFVLAAVLANILAYHITMMPATIAPALVTLALWFVVAWPLRAYFSPLFVDKAALPSR